MNLLLPLVMLSIGFYAGVSLRPAQGAVDYEEAIRAAYAIGVDEAYDDIGLKRLSLEDVQTLIEEE